MKQLYLRAAAAASLVLIASQSLAQSSYTIPNPLVRPQSVVAPGSVPDTARDNSKVPKVAVVPHGSTGSAGQGQVQPGPLPNTGAGQMAPLPSGSASPMDAVTEELGRYTVTAIVGASAVLRTNTGNQLQGAQANLAGKSSAGTPAAAGQGAQGVLRQQVLRVRSGESLDVAGVTLVPSVRDGGVEFRQRGGGAVIRTVYLDSQSAPNYEPPASVREAAKAPSQAPAAAQVAPYMNSNNSNGQSSGGSAVNVQR